jgi:phosphatidylinositol dimannoside acyltransferase
MKLQTLMISRTATAFGVGLSRLLPPLLGYPVARAIADIVSMRRSNPMVQAVRANQWVVHGGNINPLQLDRVVRETFRSSARSMYEFWHYYKDSCRVLDMVEFDSSMDACIERALGEKNGTLMVGPHITNFDMVGRALALRGMKMQILSYPQPPGGYRWQNQLRELPGVRVTPMSIQALRKASETLRAGETVLTGVDRPLPASEDVKYRPRFFGRAAALPVFYIRLALKHNLPITILGSCRKPNGCYHVWATEPIPLQRHADLVEETVTNTERVLEAIANIIRRAPEQWAMFYPVWPEVLNQANP